MRRLPITALLLGPLSAQAFDDPSLRLDADLGYACFADDRRFHGIHAGADAAWMWSDAFGLRAGYSLGEIQSKDHHFRIQQVQLGLRYQLDVFHYVPWIDVAPTLHVTSGDPRAPEAGVGLSFGVGFDYLVDDHWSVGFSSHMAQLGGSDRFPSYLHAGARLGYRWSLVDPFEP